MRSITSVFLLSLLLVVDGSYAHAQSDMPSAQQIQQFKNLPRAQQEQLARQMGFDISILQQGQGGTQAANSTNQAELVEREIDEAQISEQRARQSVVQNQARELKPFGFELFQSREAAAAPLSNMPVPPNYVLGPGDSIKLQLFGKETGSFELSVNNEGNIDVPDLGPMQVAGVGFQELKQLVNEKYNQQKIGVTPFVSMGQLRSIQVFLVGEVFRPGPLVINSLSTITTALINSGGVSEIGSLREIELKRSGKTVATFDMYELIVNGDTSNDIRLEQGDVIFVPTVERIVSVDGEVRRPALYEVLEGDNLASLMRLAGGTLPSADTSAVQLVSAAGGKGLSVNSVNLNTSEAQQISLRNGDFVRVPKATLEFSNAIKVRGAINVPTIMADTGRLRLSDILSSQTVLANTDLDYGIVARRGRLDAKTQILQFVPNEIIQGSADINLQAFDEVFLFNRVANNEEDGIAQQVADNKFEDVGEDIAEEESEFLENEENSRFSPEAFSAPSSVTDSRKTLLAPLIARLRNESSNEHSMRLVEVKGQVKYPGVYPLPEDASLQNMIRAAGGLTEAAHLEMAEISKLVVESGQSQTKHEQISLLNQLAMPEAQQVRLKPRDVLSVLRIPNWYDNETVELKGEVVFPGVYQISRGETLASIIERAGGLTQDASINAAIFTRNELKERERENIERAIEDLREQLANNNLSNSQFSRTIDYDNATRVLNDLTDVEPVGRMIINLEDIVAGVKSEDVTLKTGDVLTVPNVTPAISVIGEVFVSNTYRFDERLSIDDYIERAGGAREYADTSKIYIVRADGSVMVPQRTYWFNSDSESMLMPGDTIVVPRDVTNYDNISLWQGITQIIYQSAIAVAAIGSL
ncbi:SLBB domain-containing protein [Glaciecola sp. XM2]|uniref:SLBB domain-containing protein n=1 Tax=Glaciecola sp. XM2 TaxID=1914931 RepID=UPI001BDF1EA7|nr:SLBB domain-containing protein [Glaciecola sp. XM2]MBT1450692.1 SLBB domain-containing protein [Glaciecola sp. XM2]